MGQSKIKLMPGLSEQVHKVSQENKAKYTVGEQASISSILPKVEALRQKIKLILYDMDGCLLLDAHHDKSCDHKNMHTWLIRHNKALLDQQIAEIKQGGYQQVIIGFGTNRQSKLGDDANANGRLYCAPALPILQSYLAKETGCDVVLDPSLTADLCDSTNQNAAGDSYKAILREKYGKPTSVEHIHLNCVFDRTKISLIYFWAMRMATFHPNVDIEIDFYDDRDDLLYGLHDFFSKHSDLLPKNITLNLHQYPLRNNHFPKKVKGSGEIDTKYDWSVRYMALQTITSNSSVDALISLHENYIKKLPNMAMQYGVEFADKFKSFRDDEISKSTKLTSDEKLTQRKNYTTATELYDLGLIPKEFVMGVKQVGFWTRLLNATGFFGSSDSSKIDPLDQGPAKPASIF